MKEKIQYTLLDVPLIIGFIGAIAFFIAAWFVSSTSTSYWDNILIGGILLMLGGGILAIIVGIAILIAEVIKRLKSHNYDPTREDSLPIKH